MEMHTHTFTIQTIMWNVAILFLSVSIVLKHIFYTLGIRLKLKRLKKKNSHRFLGNGEVIMMSWIHSFNSAMNIHKGERTALIS